MLQWRSSRKQISTSALRESLRYNQDINVKMDVWMLSLDHIRDRAASLSARLVHARSGSKSEELSLGELLQTYDGPLPTDFAKSLVCPKSEEAVSPETMDRWITIEYPDAVVDRTGTYGANIKVSDALRHSAIVGGAAADYHLKLADALDESAAPEPTLRNPKDIRRERLEGCSELLDVIDAMNLSISDDAMAELRTLIELSAAEIEHGGFAWAYEGIRYPMDFIPPPNELGNVSAGMMFNTGWLLHLAARDAAGNDRARLHLALQHYPDEDIEIEVSARGVSFWLYDLRVVSELSTCSMDSAPLGSVRLDHYGPNTKFSSDPDEFDFKVYPSTDHDYDEDTYFLISESVSYAATASSD